MVYVNTLVPVEIPVTKPVLSTVAILGDAEIHASVVAGVVDAVSCVVDPSQTFNVLEKRGSEFTVTVAVCIQPLLVMYVIVLVPTATPVTTPVLLAVATDVVEEIQLVVSAGMSVPVNCVVCPKQTFKSPVIVGIGFTVTVAVCAQPFVFIYVITLVPAEIPVTIPVLLTVATNVVADAHGVVGCAVPDPVNCVVDPSHTYSVPVIVGFG